ncbi:MAG: ATP-binding protein, partial [Bradymonadaceae bacterium]
LDFVGRVAERDAIWQSLREVHETSEPRVLVVRGEAGCGKSALVEWMARRAQEVGQAIVLEARHSPLGSPVDGLYDMLAGHLQTRGLAREAVQARILRWVKEALPPGESLSIDAPALAAAMTDHDDEGVPVRFGSAQERYAALASLLRLRSMERPLLLWLDDVQWGSDALAFVQYLVEHEAGLPVLCLLTVREEALAERPVESEQLQDLLDQKGALEVAIGPLGEDDQRDLIRQLLPLDDDLVERLIERTAGNPLFAVELVGSWVERGLLVPRHQGYCTRAGAATPLPDTLHQVWLARIERLLGLFGDEAEQTRVALELAASLGSFVSHVEWEMACALTGIGHPKDLLSKMVDFRLARTDERGFSFVHEMLRESVERMAGEAGRWVGHHHICLTVLQDLYSERDQAAMERRAKHLLEIGRYEEATPLLLAAAKRRWMDVEPHVANGLLSSAEGALKKSRVAARHHWLELWTRSAFVNLQRGNWVATLNHVERIEQEATSSDGVKYLGYASLIRGGHAVMAGRIDEAAPLYRRSRDFFRTAGDNHGEGRATSAIGQIVLWQGRPSEAIACYEKALGVPEDDPFWASYDLNGLAQALIAGGDFDRAEQAVSRSLELARESGSRSATNRGLATLADICRHNGDFAQAIIHYQEHQRFMSPNSTLYLVLNICCNLAMLGQGRFEERRPIILSLTDELQARGYGLYLPILHLMALCCAGAAQDWTAWTRHLTDARQVIEELSVIERDIAWTAALAAKIAREGGRPEMALEVEAIAVEQREKLAR